MVSNYILSDKAIYYERDGFDSSGWGQDVESWQEVLNKEVEKVLLNDENKNLNKDDLKVLFSDNSITYVKKELTKYLQNIKDLNGNAVDFSTLNKKQQCFIMEFLKQPLEDVNVYCKGAYISDIKIDISDTFYIQADIHTIDGKSLSSAANFIPKDHLDYKKFDFLNFEDFDRDYKFLFTTEEKLSIEERKEFLNKIQNSNFNNDFKDLENLNAFITISFLYVNNDDKSDFPIYYNSNLKLDYAKAAENIKHLAQDKKSSEKSDNSSLVKILWENIKADFEKLKDFNKLKSEEENIFMQQKDDSMLLKSLLK